MSNSPIVPARPTSIAQQVERTQREQGLIPAPAPLNEYTITISEMDALGKKTEYLVPAPNSADYGTWSLMQRVAMLKKGPCAKYPIVDVLYLVSRCHENNLSAEDGDMFFTGEGRIGFSNKAKIKIAQRSGMIVGIEAVIKPIEGSKAPAGCTGAITDLECTATIHVKGWMAPIVNKQKLSTWFKAKNPNWVGNPEHMLKLNTIAHACELVPGGPTATGDDEMPPPESSQE